MLMTLQRTSFPVTSGIKVRWAPRMANSMFMWMNRALLKIRPMPKMINVAVTNPMRTKLADFDNAKAADFSSSSRVTISWDTGVVGGRAKGKQLHLYVVKDTFVNHLQTHLPASITNPIRQTQVWFGPISSLQSIHWAPLGQSPLPKHGLGQYSLFQVLLTLGSSTYWSPLQFSL